MSIGGTAIVDRGRSALDPIVGELRAALGEHRMLILTGAGIRARHVLGVGLDLGLPTGVLAGLCGTEAEQNGHLVAALLAARCLRRLVRFDGTGDSAELIPRISADKLRSMAQENSPIEPSVLDLLRLAKNVREIQIVNGLTPGNLTRALNGEHVGTIVHAD